MSFSRSRRATRTRRPHVPQRRPISAPSRTTRQLSPPHGCCFLKTTTSSRENGTGPFARVCVMAAKSSRRSGSSGRDDLRRKVQSGLFGDSEMRVAVDELELTDDAAGSGHGHVYDIRRTDRADRPRSAKRSIVDGERVIDRACEVALRALTHPVHRDRLSAGVPQPVHALGELTLVEPALEADPDARARD